MSGALVEYVHWCGVLVQYCTVYTSNKAEAEAEALENA